MMPGGAPPPSTALYSPPPAPNSPGARSLWTLLLPVTGCGSSEAMELWKQLRQAGLVPPGLGPPPRALRGVPPVEKVGQTLASPGAGAGGARESLLWIWKELVSEGFRGIRDGGVGSG